ncbi:hypothetical protein N0V84_008197 [Fusarium piperis]|uniref:Uncharacterized protein n=1 Tax=Fusarium piperis TaxID=1435070 RepID=A0A9W8W8I7_9HYPO|nr:hypothetical protein N0V84_008197 [Fusarium piperis]
MENHQTTAPLAAELSELQGYFQDIMADIAAKLVQTCDDRILKVDELINKPTPGAARVSIVEAKAHRDLLVETKNPAILMAETLTVHADWSTERPSSAMISAMDMFLDQAYGVIADVDKLLGRATL